MLRSDRTLESWSLPQGRRESVSSLEWQPRRWLLSPPALRGLQSLSWAVETTLSIHVRTETGVRVELRLAGPALAEIDAAETRDFGASSVALFK